MAEPVAAPERVLLIQLRRLGDVTLSTALIDDVRRAFPRARVDFLVGEAAAPLLEHHPGLTERIVYDRSRALGMIRDVRARRYDWVVDVQSSPRTAQLTMLSGAPLRAGWDIGFWGRLAYTHRQPRTGGATVYVVAERQRLLEMLGVRTEPSAGRLHLTDAERAAGEARLRAAGAEGGPAVALSLGTADPGKDWPAERYGELAAALREEGAVPVVLRAPGDDAKLARVRALAPGVAVVPPGALRDFLGALAACAVLVAGDSGPAHMATALGVPRVTIFGPTDPVAWSPGWPTTVALRDAASATVRSRPQAGADHPGVTGVSVTEVLRAVRALLGAARTTRTATIATRGLQ